MSTLYNKCALRLMDQQVIWSRTPWQIRCICKYVRDVRSTSIGRQVLSMFASNCVFRKCDVTCMSGCQRNFFFMGFFSSFFWSSEINFDITKATTSNCNLTYEWNCTKCEHHKPLVSSCIPFDWCHSVYSTACSIKRLRADIQDLSPLKWTPKVDSGFFPGP